MAQHVIKIPVELADELDRLAGHKRTALASRSTSFGKNCAGPKQRQVLRLSASVWKDHTELAEGRAACIDQVRAGADERFESALMPVDRLWPSFSWMNSL
jgi:hypothetical protein